MVLAVRQAQDAGLDAFRWRGWLDIPAERAVIEARVEADREAEILEQRDEKVEAVLAALREQGYTTWRPEDVEFNGGDEQQ